MTIRGGYVQSLDRGLAVIRAFDAAHTRLTLSEVANRSGLSRATARRLLHTLVHLGYVAAHGQHFTLRQRIRELGDAYLDSLSLPRRAAPHVTQLAQELGESATVAVLDGEDIVYVVRAAAPRYLQVDLGVGTRMPAADTAMGRILLGEVGEQGWAAVDVEPGTGLSAVAVPICEAGAVVAALGVELIGADGAVAGRVRQVLPALHRTAGHIGAEAAGDRAAGTGQRRERVDVARRS